MSEHDEGANEDVETSGDDSGADMVPMAKFQSALSQRRREKERRQELETSHAELSAKLAEFEAAEAERQETAMRKKGEFEKLLEQERASKAQLMAENESLKWGNRFAATTQAVAQASGLDPVVVEGLLLREKNIKGTDVALESLSDDGVAELVDAIRSSAPSVFQRADVGGGPTGGGESGGSSVAELAKRIGARNRKHDRS